MNVLKKIIALILVLTLLCNISICAVSAENDAPFSVSTNGSNKNLINSEDISGVPVWDVVVPPATTSISISNVANNIVGIYGTKYLENEYEAALIVSERYADLALVATGDNAYDQSTGTYTVQLNDFELQDGKTLIPFIGEAYFSDYNYEAFLRVSYRIAASKDKLSEAINSVPDETGYYTQDDRYNGNVYQEAGFWSDMQSKLSEAKKVLNDSGATQELVDKATTNLTTAINALISKENINPTILYEALNTTWRWWQGGLSNTTGTPVSADNCTAITCWTAYTMTRATRLMVSTQRTSRIQ